MSTMDNNPYSTPTAKLDSEIAINHRMQQMPRFSAWGVLGLSILTLGIYYTYWMFTRTRLINRIHDRTISMNLVIVVIGLLIASQVFGFMSNAETEAGNYRNLSTLTSIAYSISNLFWVFTVRNRIHQMSAAGREQGFWLGGILTFFLQVIYMQYKINEYHDTQLATQDNLAS